MYENSRFLKNRFTFCGINTNFGQQWAPPAYYHLTPIVSKGKHCRRSLVTFYYTSKHMYNWMKWLRLLGGWHFIAATAIKPPKAACQFAADDILLYKICYNIQWIYFTIWEKGKEELSPLQYHFKSLHIISRHYKKSLLRSPIYHGYEELSTDTNYPIWRRQKLPYMKKTRKKKQVCGAACFMAAEIKFSEDVRPASGVCSVASTVQDGFFPYLVQMINGMRGCVTCEDPWPWPISSRSFGLDLENRVRSVASTVLDGFFLY